MKGLLSVLNDTGAPVLSTGAYYAVCSGLVIAVMAGIFLMSKVEKALLGNRLSAVAMALAIGVTLVYKQIVSTGALFAYMAAGAILGLIWAKRAKMIQMPQIVALLNGFGGAASAVVAVFALHGIGAGADSFSRLTSALALAVGAVTFTGSLVAAGKLHNLLPPKPVVLPSHERWTLLALVLTVAGMLLSVNSRLSVGAVSTAVLVCASAFGVIFSIKVGGADMPITISLLNSFSGVAGAVAGLAVGDVLLVSVGGIVGASGLLLTQIMCKAMNRSLPDIFLGKTTTRATAAPGPAPAKAEPVQTAATPDVIPALKRARNVIIVPGYGMAIAQAQHLVKKLADKLTANGATVKYAIHPVAGRMPGHMNVLLCEANVDYEDLHEMDAINPEFENADVTVVVGANDVLNPAAREAEGTPIYGMPILNVDACKTILIFNYDRKPGYAGVPNPIFARTEGVYLELGNAAETLQKVLDRL